MKQMDACHGPSLWEEVVIAKRWNRLVNKIMRDDDTGKDVKEVSQLKAVVQQAPARRDLHNLVREGTAT